MESSVTVPIADLTFTDGPRLDGERPEHVQALAGLDADLPPILVHRQTMAVIDGVHRVRAALQNGRREIAVRFFDGTPQDAFVAAVKENIGHGLPLTPADREAAAVRILASHPQWSDRAIAQGVGMSATTIAKIRARSTAGEEQPASRIGRDGRVRPISSAAGRRFAARLFAERPEVSLREIAELAGISPATAIDVRERLRRGEDPVPPKQLLAEQRSAGAEIAVPARPARPSRAARLRTLRSAPDPQLALSKLRRDPSLRLTDSGRGLLRLLNARSFSSKDWEELETGIPAHCLPLVADLALSCADEWARVAQTLADRERRELA